MPDRPTALNAVRQIADGMPRCKCGKTLGHAGRCPGSHYTVNRASRYQTEVQGFIRRFLLSELAANGWNRARTARALGIERTYLLRLIRDRRLILPARTTPS